MNIDIKELKIIIKELNNICENVYEIHSLMICNKLYKLNNDIKHHISNDYYYDYERKIENLYFESFFYKNKFDIEVKIIMNDIISLISGIIILLNRIILNYP